MANEIILPVTKEEYEKATSKFASVGLHLSEVTQVPTWDTPNVSIKWEFQITEEGQDHGKTGKISSGVAPDAVWKTRECQAAVGIKETFVKTKDGSVRPKVDYLPALGASFYSEWTLQKDTRPADKGGKGTTYTKPTKMYSVAEGRRILGLDKAGAVDDIEGNLDVEETE